MKPDETIIETSTRFIYLIGVLKALDKMFDESELVKKIVKSLLKSCEVKPMFFFDTMKEKLFRNDVEEWCHLERKVQGIVLKYEKSKRKEEDYSFQSWFKWKLKHVYPWWWRNGHAS